MTVIKLMTCETQYDVKNGLSGANSKRKGNESTLNNQQRKTVRVSVEARAITCEYEQSDLVLFAKSDVEISRSLGCIPMYLSAQSKPIYFRSDAECYF